jgi:hypothetical protein
MSALFDAAYVAVDDPRAQSGFGGDESRWEAGRRPIVKAIDRDERSSMSAARTAT